MAGGAGADIFRFNGWSDFDRLEVIVDFEHGVDKIVLRYIDARPGVGIDDAFYFDPDRDYDDFLDDLDDWGTGVVGNGSPVINGDAGEVTFRHDGGNTYVYLSSGDHQLSAQIMLQGHVTLTASDFFL
jgi:Ca2+-binding RTX toxin-like protein